MTENSIYKIQAFSKKSSPYQRIKDLVSLILHTASGRVGIPYIPERSIGELGCRER